MGIVVIGAVFVDIKGYPTSNFIPTGRNAGKVEHVHGGVARNVAEDIANCELRPTFISLVDDTGTGTDVVRKLNDHKVNTQYIRQVRDGMGTWLVVFDNNGDVAGSISKRPIMRPLIDILEEKGDEIFANADSVVLEVDLEKELVKKVLELGKKHNTKLFGLVSNMSLAVQRRDFIKQFDCTICNQLEAGILFADDYSEKNPEELCEIISHKVSQANFPALVVTMGGEGAVYADYTGVKGVCPPRKVQVKDTTGAGDAFCAGVAAAMTYGKTLPEAVEIGTLLAASVITSTDNVCPRFMPGELGIDVNFD